jgi:D-glycero-alpha-D-manno-heptose-7-phosphate kinase
VIVTRTPVRVSFLGGGTDYPDYFRRHGGQTLGVAIDRYSYITVNRLAGLFDYTIRVSYSRMELATRLEDVQHPAVRECLRFLKIDGGVEIHYVGDLPARTGLGSSSSFTVALLHALHTFEGSMASQQQLAEEACHVEHEMIRERVGVQDQYTCAFGGLVHLRMAKDGRVTIERVPLPAERLAALQAHLMLLYTGIRRDAHAVLEEQLDRTRSGAIAQDLSQLGALVDEGVETLSGSGPIERFGELLDSAWQIKRQLSSKITSDAIDGYYARARAAGAVGGKLLGAGGGGFLLLFVPPARQAAVASALAELPRVSFGFDHEGSRILFYQPQ